MRQRSGQLHRGIVVFCDTIVIFYDMEVPTLWVSTPIIRNIVLVAVARGADLDRLCREGGITPDMLEKADLLFSLEQNCKIMEAAMQLTGDPFLGLHIGETISPVVLGMVGHLMESSPDLLTAFDNLESFVRTVTKLYEFYSEVRGDEFIMYCEPVPAWNSLSPETARMSVDLSFSGMMHIVKLLTGKTLYPVRLSMRYPRPRDTREYVRVLKIEPAFNQSCNCTVFRLKDVRHPVIGHNPSLNALFKELLEKEISKTREARSFSNEVRRVVLQHFIDTIPQLTEVSDLLNMTPRTLQRKLKEEGATYQSIAESVKSELAIGLLKSRSLTVNEIAYKLGYAEPSVFRRAFKKWTGTTPKAHV